MKAKQTANTDRIGISAVQLHFELMGYSFREQPISDYGIDAHIEIVEEEQATGRLLAAQIKSGQSWFEEPTEHGFVYRGDANHLSYWLNHVLPVIVVLYDPTTKSAYWQVISRETVTSTGKGWKVELPHSQRVDASSKPAFQQLAGFRIAEESYTILALRDVSHNGAKRYTANILISDRAKPFELKELITRATDAIKQREYYRNEQAKQRWSGTPAQVVHLFVYQSMDDVFHANWICRTQWIDTMLPAQFSPMALQGEALDSGILVDWSSRYVAMRQWYHAQTLTKEAYLDTLQAILTALQPHVEHAISVSTRYEAKQIASEQYVNDMRALEPIVTALYRDATDMGVAPYECTDVNRRFKSLVAFAHDIVLPFSERGLHTWQEPNRHVVVRNAVHSYQACLIRLRFELEKMQ